MLFPQLLTWTPPSHPWAPGSKVTSSRRPPQISKAHLSLTFSSIIPELPSSLYTHPCVDPGAHIRVPFLGYCLAPCSQLFLQGMHRAAGTEPGALRKLGKQRLNARRFPYCLSVEEQMFNPERNQHSSPFRVLATASRQPEPLFVSPTGSCCTLIDIFLVSSGSSELLKRQQPGVPASSPVETQLRSN